MTSIGLIWNPVKHIEPYKSAPTYVELKMGTFLAFIAQANEGLFNFSSFIFVLSRSCNNLNFFFALFQMLSGQLRKKCYRAMSGLIFSLEFSSNFRYNYASFCNVAVRFECRKKVLNCSTAVQNLLKYFLKEYCIFLFTWWVSKR